MMNQTLVDFLNHGVLPFVGRNAEMERILAFWRATTESTRLRGALLIGEAGIGKSRIIEEIIPQIVQEGGAVVHAKLYPESTTSIAPLVAGALRFLSTRRQLNIGDTEETLPSVVAALRRLARLRPTLLLIEDIHLLNGETLREFALLLDALSEDVISVVALTRPIELPARGVLERYLIEELTITLLEPEQVETLWERLFGRWPDPEITALVLEATHGNPLALRSALRGAVKSGAISYDPPSNTWLCSNATAVLPQVLKRNVELLLEGLAAYLNEKEREGAMALASLGELFTREAAEGLVDGAGKLLDSLMFKGVIMTARTQAAPLPGGGSAYPPLAFTHTLLHTRLVEQARIAPEALLRIIARNYPLCSILPFQLLAAAPQQSIDSEGDEARQAIARALEMARALDNGPDWKLGMELWQAAEKIAPRCWGGWPAEERTLLEADILSTWLLLARRSGDHRQYEICVQNLLALTDDPSSTSMREYRLRAFSFLHALDRRKAPELRMDTWSRAQRFIHAYPELLFTDSYLAYMDSAARSMLARGDRQTLRLIDEQLTALIESDLADDHFRRQARRIIILHSLDLFSTQEELQARLEQMDWLEPFMDSRNRMRFLSSKLMLLTTIGQMEEALRTADMAIPLFKEQNLPNDFHTGSVARLYALGGLGAISMEEMEGEIERLSPEAPMHTQHFRAPARTALIEMALLRNERQWLIKGVERHANALRHLRPEAGLLLALECDSAAHQPEPAPEKAGPLFRPLLLLHRSEIPPPLHIICEAFVRGLNGPLLRLHDIIEKRALLALIDNYTRRMGVSELAGLVAAEAAGMLHRALAWLAERRLYPCMLPLLEQGRSYLNEKELRGWRESIGRLAEQQRSARETEAEELRQRTRISMLGTIEIRRPDGEIVPVRGSRLRALLGLLVADRMLDIPLDYREFSAIASGSEGDPERARKTLNGIVFRLRDAIGHDLVETGSETPRLNFDLVEVDLLEAHRAILEANEALRDRSLLRSQQRMLRALDLTRGEVPFPNLYENFFEAVREDFENELRNTLVHVAQRLLMEGDPKSAEELLRRGFDAMAEDEEIADLLCEALVQVGKRAEAERVRMRAAIAMEG